MSLFGSIGKLLKGAAPIVGGSVGTAIGGPLGGIFGGALGGAFGGAKKPPNIRSLPGGGVVRSAGTGAVIGGATAAVGSLFGGGGVRRRRRGRGFSARDIRQTRRMLALVRDVERSCPPRRSAARTRRVCR